MEKIGFDSQLDRLATLAVGFGLGLKPGQELIMTADIGARPLANRITEAAYAAGASNVVTLYSDDAAVLAKFTHGTEAALDAAPGWLFDAAAGALMNGAARLAIAGDTPGLLAGQDPARVARANNARAVAGKPFLDAITSGKVNWSIVPFVTEGWAHQVFPGLTRGVAAERLWEHVFEALRLDRPGDPVAAWEAHFAELARRRDALNAARFDALHFEGGGTDLTVGLARGHRWVGGGNTLPDGTAYAPNLPTEEVFTMPDRSRTEGRAVFTKPAVIGGSIVEGLEVTFEAGRAVRIEAEKNAEVARNHFATDEGASRLGEVALVPESSPIARSGVLFFNTLFDENAACHIAFGNAYAMNLDPGADRTAAGMNQSRIHHDCMIGSPEIRVTGVTAAGARVPVMEQGEFVI
ncbi:MAG: aminopeptidase [Rhodobacterales bacterium]|nr:MAG: aminopeptidase [Rhodobacterales bacterium]